MKKTNPVYITAVLIGLFVMMIALTIITTTDSSLSIFIVVGLVIMIVIIKVAISLSNGTLEQRSMIFRPCIKCNEEIESNSEFCKHCGASQIDAVVCEYCGVRNEKDATFCKECNALIK